MAWTVRHWWRGILLIALCSPHPALAGDTCLTQAEQLYQSGSYEQALEGLGRCPPGSQSLFLRGHILWKLHQYQGAQRAFVEYLKIAQGDERQAVELLIKELKILLRTQVTIISDPPGCEVRLDDPLQESMGQTPLELNLRPGEHTLYLAKEGYQTSETIVVAKLRQRTPVQVRLKRMTSAESVVASPGDRPPEPPVEQDPLPRSGERRSLLPVILSGAATAVAGAIALGFGISAKAARERYDESLLCADLEVIKDHALVADVMIGVTGAAAISTAIFYWLWHRDGKESAPRVTGSINGLRVRF